MYKYIFCLVSIITCSNTLSCHISKTPSGSNENCSSLLSPELTELIGSYKTVANEIYQLIINGELKGEAFRELENLVDLYPTRPSGSKGLENSIDYMISRMKDLGLENVRGEQVTVPHWVRGEEKAELLEPFQKSLSVLGLGFSVPTSTDGITAPVLVVQTFEELTEKKDQVPGKIVVYNQGWVDDNYSKTAAYRLNGASEASKYGAIAALIESAAPFSLNTPHTGVNLYQENVTQIPVACITKEDAALLYRLQQRENATDMKIFLKILSHSLPNEISRNVFGDVEGHTKVNEFVALTGHIDAWDVGQGAMDDGSGVVISVMALAALKRLNLIPYRSLQAILWTAEEMDFWGVRGFARQNLTDLENYSVMFESDFGVFTPRGLNFAGNETAGCIVNEILKLVSNTIGDMNYERENRTGADIAILQDYGVPGLNLMTENDKYFWYHHTGADTLLMIDSDELDLNTALLAITSFVLADIPFMLPRDVQN